MADTRIRRLSLLTPTLTSRRKFLAATRDSVRAARALTDWQIDWLVALADDNPGPVAHVLSGEAQLLAWTSLPGRIGPSVGRNVALAAAAPGWVMALDDDDLLDCPGLAALLAEAALSSAGWLSFNHVLFDGARTIHWHEQPRSWQAGELEEHWTTPFPFHPSAMIVRRELALAAGGWPALPANEDLGFALAVSSLAPGASLPHIARHYRLHDSQAIAQPGYTGARTISFTIIEGQLNARRRAAGKSPLRAPTSVGTLGHERLDRST